MCWISRMARARYGGERGAGPLAARLRACGPATARSATRRREALWSAATSDPARRHAPARQARRLAHSRACDASQTYHELFRAYPFTVLDETEHDARLRPVRADLDARPRLPGARRTPEAFADWDEPGTVRVAFAHWVEPLERRRRRAASPRRACSPVDTHARLRLKAIWAVLGPFERLVGAEPLELAVRRAESTRIALAMGGLGARGPGRPATDRGGPPPARRGAAGRRSTASPR